MFKKLILSLVLACMSAGALASSFTGTVQKVYTSAGIDNASNTRVTVYTGNTTSCGATGYYEFEFAANGSGPGAAFLAQLLDAQLLQSTVSITGTGACDDSVEVVSMVVSQ